MPAVHLHNVSFRYSTAVDVVADADVHLGPGWAGIVGANGSGKTTLLRLLAGELTPAVGAVVVDPPDGVIAFGRQEVETRTPDIDRFAASWDPFDVTLRGRLDLGSEDLDRWAELSPGERKRWQIGAALAAQPDVLLLDEPTNHLDADARDLVVAALERFAGVGLVVSHDRVLLDRLTTRTVWIERGSVSVWSGSYTTARGSRTAEEQVRRRNAETLKRTARLAERRLADQRRANEAKRARFRRRQRTSAPKDIDARSAARTSAHREGEASAASRLAAAAKQRDRAAQAVERIEGVRELGGEVFVGFEPAPKPVLARIAGPLRAGGRVVLQEADVALERTDRVWLRGANGAGKTTLMGALLDAAENARHRILHLPQELAKSEVDGLLDTVRALPPVDRGRVLAILALLGTDPVTVLASDRPSPGEARKLALALGLGTRAWAVLLDEPTNHLDLPSIERLEMALAAYPGAMVVVTHDEPFAERLGLVEWVIEHGRLVTPEHRRA